MGEHDAVSVVGQMAGLKSRSGRRPEKVTPERLIKAFCGENTAGRMPDPGETEKDGVKTARGHSGYIGGRGDSLAVGFDDGYDFMGYLSEGGWKPLDEKGDWPYVVYMLTKHDESYAVAEYCEGDLVVTVLPTQEKTKAFYAGLRDAP
jgi:hypothetical protein